MRRLRRRHAQPAKGAFLEHLDEDKTDILSGGRLDGNGNRQGKLVKYATSEFRTSHLLDQVCDYADTFVPRYEGGWAPNATKAQRFEDVVRGKAKPFPKLNEGAQRGGDVAAETALLLRFRRRGPRGRARGADRGRGVSGKRVAIDLPRRDGEL